MFRCRGCKAESTHVRVSLSIHIYCEPDVLKCRTHCHLWIRHDARNCQRERKSSNEEDENAPAQKVFVVTSCVLKLLDVVSYSTAQAVISKRERQRIAARSPVASFGEGELPTGMSVDLCRVVLCLVEDVDLLYTKSQLGARRPGSTSQSEGAGRLTFPPCPLKSCCADTPDVPVTSHVFALFCA